MAIASEPEISAVFRLTVSSHGTTVLMPILPMGIMVEPEAGAAIAPGEVVKCKLRAGKEGMMILCGKTEFRFYGVAVSSD
jgi:hypothetical protein